MAFQLGDIFIGNFKISQQFGARPDVYFARYKLKGHNGTDFACPTMTPILAAADGWVSEAGFDASGYGNYIKVVHDGYFTIYGHLNDRLVNFKDKVVAGQIIGHSNNSGFSEGPHLHFGVAPCDVNGIKTELSNGYSGYVNPMGDRCQWIIKNLTEPMVPSLNQKPDVAVPSSTFVELVSKSTNWDIVASYFKLTDVEKVQPKSGEMVVSRIVEIVHQMEQKNEHDTSPSVPVPVPDPEQPMNPQEASVLFTDLSVLLKKAAKYLPFIK